MGGGKKFRLLADLDPAIITYSLQDLVFSLKSEEQLNQLVLKFSSNNNNVWKSSSCIFVLPASPRTPMLDLSLRAHVPTSREVQDGRLKYQHLNECSPFTTSSQLALCCGIESAFL